MKETLPARMSVISPKPGSISVVIRLYKGSVTRWGRKNGYPEFGWQQRFYDHIIRHQRALDRIRRYIRLNPQKWALDRYHVDL
jgi:REP element-mobilizing transposase RayT